jgi:hypothetical protein
MSILDNLPCEGYFGRDREDEPLLKCERCGKAYALDGDEWCRACIDAQEQEDSDPLATTLLDIAGGVPIHDLLNLLTPEEREQMVAEGRT